MTKTNNKLRREYTVSLTINSLPINKVIIDPHYEEKHSESINDEVVLELVRLLDKGTFPAIAVEGEFQYFKSDPLFLEDKKYRLVWLLKKAELFIGIVNAHRRD